MISSILDLEIIPVHACKDEISDLIKREELAALAKQRFLNSEISFTDFLDCLELAQINIDDFLICANQNSFDLGF